jgi:hypothetical protein
VTKIQSYINLYFALGVGLFSISKIIPNFTFLYFYLFYNLFGIFFLIFILCKSREFGIFNSINFLIVGFLFFLAGNITFLENLSLIDITNYLFIIQILIKQAFIFSNYFKDALYCRRETILSVLILNCLIYIFCSTVNLNFKTNFFDLFYFVESLTSLALIANLHLNHNVNPDVVMEWFLLGQLIWLLADLIYSDLNIINLYVVGDYADFIYFVGFYFFIKSFNLKFGFKFKPSGLDVAKTYI